MNCRTALLAATCALALAACGPEDRPRDADPPSDATLAPSDTAARATSAQDFAPVLEDRPATMATTASGQPGVGTAAGAEDLAGGGADAADQAAASATAAAKAPATVSNCSTTIEGNDRIQFNVDAITIPSSCAEFTINLRHVGSLPEAAMGHNVVVTTSADYPGVAADGLTAGAGADYVPAGDDRVIAATEMIGGGESTAVTFATGGLDPAGDYTFFCSFPGHSAIMRGSLRIGG